MTKHSPSKNAATGGSEQDRIDRACQRAVEAALSSRGADLTSAATSTAPINSVAIDSVAVKLPGFWKDNPRGWFHQAELSFEIRNPPITVSRTKYGHVVTSLDSQASTEVQAVLDEPPTTDPYAALKAALLLAYDSTQATKDKELLAITSLGDLKATQMLRKMTRLASPGSASTTLFRHSFLLVLPADVRAILATLDDPLPELAVKADRIIEARGSTVAAISSDPSFSSLCQEVAALKVAVNNRPSSRNSGRSNTPDAFVCVNHTKYGPKAYNCKPGCSFANSPLAQRPGNSNASR